MTTLADFFVLLLVIFAIAKVVAWRRRSRGSICRNCQSANVAVARYCAICGAALRRF